jgi:hypothetical protein
MKKHEKEKHLIEYLLYFVFMGSFIVLFWYFRGIKEALIYVSATGCLTYILWGIFHHHKESRLYKEIIFEYVFLGILVFLLLLTAISF